LLNSPVLEVSIGLLVCYGSVALMSSSIYEAIASLLKLRGRSLLDGVKSLLNDPTFSNLALKVYNHALVNPREGGVANAGAPPATKPSYIEPRAFAIAVLDSIGGISAPFAQLKDRITDLPDGQIRNLLLGMYTRADGQIEKLHSSLAEWFDAGMNRVSGAYKRQAQLMTCIIAFVVAGALNIDTFHLFSTLWRHPELAANADIESLPVGWTTAASLASLSPVSICGWFVTALSALFGAPFWFDLLQRLVNIRGAGGKPKQA